MRDIFYSSWSEAIGYTLIHSLWLGLAGLVLVILISRFVDQKLSTIRYWSFVGILMLVFIANIGVLIQSTSLTDDSDSIKAASYGLNSNAFQFSDSFGFEMDKISTLKATVQSALPYFVMFWWAGIVILFVRLSVNLIKVRQLTRPNHLPVSNEIAILFEELQSKLAINKIVRLVQSKHVSIPSVVGYLKPIILLPIGLTSGLSINQIEAILLHELSHIKRHDFLINIIQSLIEVLYFFNPFIWLISRFIRDEREHACDDAAVSQGISPKLFASTLTDVFSYAIQRQQLALTFASRNKTTLKRIQRIMKTQRNNNSNKLMATTIFVVAITFSMYFGAQSHAPNQAIKAMGPERAIMAMTFPIFDSPKAVPTLIAPPVIEKFKKRTAIETDTTDLEKLEIRQKEFEKAMDNLKSSKEWQEVEKMSKEMAKKHTHYMKEIGPEIEEAIKMAEEAMQFNQQELMVLSEHMEVLSDQLEDMNIDFDKDFDFDFNFIIDTEAIEEAMREIEVELESINLEEIEEMTAQITKEAESIAAEADKLAEEASVYGEKVDDFLTELKPQLIKDGYIKSKEDLKSLKIDDGEVWINDKKIDDKDAQRYIKTHQKYFEGKGFYMN